MRYRITICGTSPLITHNGAAGLDTRSPANIEKALITSKRGPRTEPEEQRLRELECLTSLYLDHRGAPTLPTAALRSNIETAARRLRHGPKVREGLIVEQIEQFDYDHTLGKTAKQLARSCQFTTGVRVGTSRILRTRAKFDQWAVTFVIETDDELIDKEDLLTWLDIGGRRIGIGDWRPEKSGHYGRYKLDNIQPIH
jgi:hypothetical protein